MILRPIPHKRRLTYLVAKYVKPVRQTLKEICHTSSQDPCGTGKPPHMSPSSPISGADQHLKGPPKHT